MGTRFFKVGEGSAFGYASLLWTQTGAGTPVRFKDALFADYQSVANLMHATSSGLYLGSTETNYGQGSFTRISPSGIAETYTFTPSGEYGSVKAFFQLNGQTHIVVDTESVGEKILKIDSNDRYSSVGDVAKGDDSFGFALSSTSDGFKEIGDNVYFSTFVDGAYNSGTTSQNIVYKLTAGGTLTKLATHLAGVGTSYAEDDPDFTQLGSTIYFAGGGKSYGHELYKLNSSGVVSLAKDINTGSHPNDANNKNSSDPHNLTAFDGSVFFAAYRADVGEELFRVSSTGTVSLVANIYGGISSSNLDHLTVYDNTLYFSADSAGHGKELWKVTDTGAVSMAAELRAGSEGSDPRDFTLFDGKLYFNAATAFAERQWYTVNSSGTITAAAPSLTSVNFSGVEVAGDKLYFTMSEGSDTRSFNLSGVVTNEKNSTGVAYASYETGAPLKGTSGANTLNGTSKSEAIFGYNAADTLNGNGGHDAIFGGSDSAIDKLNGGSGNDLLHGGKGNDVLTGGSGGDAFYFETTLSATNIDKITDFTAKVDRLALDEGIFTAVGGTTLAATKFKIIGVGNATIDSSDRIIYNSDNGKLYYDSNGSGSGNSFHFATLKTGLLLTEKDFYII